MISGTGVLTSAQILKTKDFDMKSCIRLFGRRDSVIKTQDEFLKAVRKDAREKYCPGKLEKIDFSKNCLLGINLNTDYCREPLGLKY